MEEGRAVGAENYGEHQRYSMTSEQLDSMLASMRAQGQLDDKWWEM